MEKRKETIVGVVGSDESRAFPGLYGKGKVVRMIQMYTARTSEIDEIDVAVAEIKSQIDFGSLKKNTGGLIFCHIDFVDSGVVAALCEALPFNVIGMTSMASVDEHGYGLFDLTLTVLTSDEVTFEAVVVMLKCLYHEVYSISEENIDEVLQVLQTLSLLNFLNWNDAQPELLLKKRLITAL